VRSEESQLPAGSAEVGTTRRQRWIALCLGVATLLVIALAWTWRHPHAFQTADGYSVSQTHWTVGAPAYFGIDGPSATNGSVLIHSVRADGLRDSANAEIKFYVCTVGAASGVGMIGESELVQSCAVLATAEGAEMHLDDSQRLVVSITASRPGDVSFESAGVTYSYGWRRGTQHVGGRVSLHVAEN
jgi:hypothetical protein